MMSGRGWLPASVFCLFLVGQISMAAEDAPKPAEPRWLSNWEEARKIARASGKPLFVVFRCEH